MRMVRHSAIPAAPHFPWVATVRRQGCACASNISTALACSLRQINRSGRRSEPRTCVQSSNGKLEVTMV